MYFEFGNGSILMKRRKSATSPGLMCGGVDGMVAGVLLGSVIVLAMLNRSVG